MIKLYKKDHKGNVRVWKIWEDGEQIFIHHGLLHGNMIEEILDVEARGNKTVEEQIEVRIDARINGKLNNGYVRNINKVESSGKNQLGLERQMKAVLLRDGDTPDVCYDQFSFVQRKYNGHRCSITKIDGSVLAYSSGGKAITSISHILNSIEIHEGQKLDGELYIHGLSLQKISSLVRKKEVQCPDVKFVCFDQILSLAFYYRYIGIPKQKSSNIIIAETIHVNNFEEVKMLFHKFKAEKYEGAMLRHGGLGYEAGKRSKSIYKIKKLDGIGYYDEEFKVIRILESVEGWARLECITNKGEKFKVSAPGNHYEKTEVLKNRKNYIGKHVMVEFPEWTDDGKPSQPVAIMWRNKKEE